MRTTPPSQTGAPTPRNRRSVLSLIGGAACVASATAPAVLARPPARDGVPGETIDLWPGTAPGMPDPPPVETVIDRSRDPATPDRAVHGIARPRMTLFRPAHANGAAVLVMPGGGYRHIVIDKEGVALAHWLTARGFAVFLLFYRLPGEGWAAGPDVALADAQRAMRLIRHRARSYAIDPQRVAALGFSAGGHLCADLLTRFATPLYAPVDAADTLSARPDGAAPIYPVVTLTGPFAHAGSRSRLLGDAIDEARAAAHSPDRNVPADAPPVFLLHAEDDPAVPVENSLMLRAALRAKGIAVETHLYARGGHGFGLRGAAGKPVAAWPGLLHAWLNATLGPGPAGR